MNDPEEIVIDQDLSDGINDIADKLVRRHHALAFVTQAWDKVDDFDTAADKPALIVLDGRSQDDDTSHRGVRQIGHPAT